LQQLAVRLETVYDLLDQLKVAVAVTALLVRQCLVEDSTACLATTACSGSSSRVRAADGGLGATEASTWQLGPVPLLVWNTPLVEWCQLLPEVYNGVNLFTGQ